MFAAYVIVTWRGGGQITREALITARPRRDLQIAGLLARQRPKQLLAHSPTIRATCRPRSVVAAGSAASPAQRSRRLPGGCRSGLADASGSSSSTIKPNGSAASSAASAITTAGHDCLLSLSAVSKSATPAASAPRRLPSPV